MRMLIVGVRTGLSSFLLFLTTGMVDDGHDVWAFGLLRPWRSRSRFAPADSRPWSR
jgi:hypothetical protein